MKELSPEHLFIVETKLNDWAKKISHEYRIPSNRFRISLRRGNIPKIPRDMMYGYFVSDTGSYHEHMMAEHHSVVRPKKTKLITGQELLDKSGQNIIELHGGPILQIIVYWPYKKDEGLSSIEWVKECRKIIKVAVRRTFKRISDPRQHNDDELYNPLVVGSTVHKYYLNKDNSSVRGVWKKELKNPNELNDTHKKEYKIENIRTIKFTHKETGVSYTVIDAKDTRNTWDLEQECWEKCSKKVHYHKENLVEESKVLVPVEYYNQTNKLIIKSLIEEQARMREENVRNQVY